MSSERLRRWINLSGFLLAYLSIAFIGWAARSVLLQPYDGLNWLVPSGEVLGVDSSGPAQGKIAPDDVILAVDDRLPERALPLYSGKQPGDVVEFVVERPGGLRTVSIELQAAPRSVAAQWMAVYFVAAAFWAGGLFILTYAQAAKKAFSFFTWCLAASLVLSSGALSPTGPTWVSSLFNVLLWMSGPLTIHFHLIFLEKQIPYRKAVLYGLYGLSYLGSLPFIIWGAEVVRASSIFDSLYALGRLNLSLGFLFSLGLLIHSYRSAEDSASKQRIQIVGLSAAIALMPTVVFNLLPDALLKQQLLPYEASFLFLIAIPVGYGYAIVRHRLIRLDRYLNRGASYTLIILVEAAAYLALIGLLRAMLPRDLVDSSLVQVSTVLLLGAIFPVIRDRMQRLVDRAFYGGWYDYRSAVERITGTLQSIMDSERLAELLSKRVREALRLESAAIVVLGPFGTVLGIDRENAVAHNDRGQVGPVPELLPQEGILWEYLQGLSKPIETRICRQRLFGASLTDGEHKLLHLIDGVIWAPIHGPDGLVGLLILGPRLANESFHALDFDILRQVSQHVSAVIENLGLLHRLRTRAEEVERLNRRIVAAREDERRALSHELHDEVIQDLVALTYKMRRGSNEGSEELRTQVREVIQSVREIVRELRPPVLDNLGLVPALRGCVRDFRERSGQSVLFGFHTNCEDEDWFPEDIAITIYRVAFESLSNIQKHADARSVDINLSCEGSQIILEVQDDGVGFSTPDNLGQLVMDRHYGLVTMRERLELVGGRLELETSPGQGTAIRARIPIPQGDRSPTREREATY